MFKKQFRQTSPFQLILAILREYRNKTRKQEASFCRPLLPAILLRKLTDNSTVAYVNSNGYQCTERQKRKGNKTFPVDLDIPDKTL